MEFLIYAMIYAGAGLMIYNIIGFIRFATFIRDKENGVENSAVLNLPIALLIMFFLGYVAVGIFLPPQLIVALILFGGSIFVFIMYLLLNRITLRVIEMGAKEAQRIADEESSRAKIGFLSTASHEMRTPMNIIIGANAAVMREPGLSEHARDQLKKIELSADHLLSLINNILDLNRIQQGRLVAKAAPFALCDLIDQINLVAHSMCEEKKLTYVFNGPEESPCRFVGDEAMIKHVLISLLDNGVKFTDAPGRVELSVSVEEGSEGTHTLRLAVKDTGIGIDSAFLPKLFVAFSQEDSSATNRFGGSGLSLAMVKNMVELMKGSIEVESQKNVGSVFTVLLPLKICEQTEEAEEPQEEISLAGRRVLIVEDLPENAEIVADLLELEEVETEHAENGQIALDMFRASPAGYYDAILMDLRMPVMDGLTAAREIRKLPHPDAGTVPIIALTANSLQSDIENTFAAGMNAHLSKPSDADTLYRALRKYIKH